MNRIPLNILPYSPSSLSRSTRSTCRQVLNPFQSFLGLCSQKLPPHVLIEENRSEKKGVFPSVDREQRPDMSDPVFAPSSLPVAKHPKSNPKPISYGTAGFRSLMGLLGALRSKYKKGLGIGIMITASHNPEEDNGVKIVDPMGEMMDSSWEEMATQLANVEDDLVDEVVQQIADNNSIVASELSTVLIARDTRESSPSLAEAAVDGVRAAGGLVKDYGILTTPQLHFLVKAFNTGNPDPKEEEYYDQLSAAFLALNKESKGNNKYSPTVYVDCANGVGALKVKPLLDLIGDRVDVKLINVGEGRLNYNCGADYVKLYQKSPEGLQLKSGTRYASFDGDADRIVYYYGTNGGSTFHLLDGDKIALLFAFYLKKLLTEASLESLDLCIVQTAYANGASTRHISDTIKVTTDCVSTGVKHLHHRAVQSDIGVYFEANGHGTVVFNKRAVDAITEAAVSDQRSADKLFHIMKLINQTTGDAISDLLLVETILRNLDWSVDDWDQLYTDLPSRQLKVNVTDRNSIKTTDAERKCVAPAGLQDAIDAYVKKLGPNARSFVRPSGTEDIVRVYAEAETQEKADLLAEAIASAVQELANDNESED